MEVTDTEEIMDAIELVEEILDSIKECVKEIKNNGEE